MNLDIRVTEIGSQTWSDSELEQINLAFDKLITNSGIIPHEREQVGAIIDGEIWWIWVENVKYLPDCYIEFLIFSKEDNK